ncbi:LacI family DNA-binding transcriptional regulator [Streptomyces sp. NPDC093591]|uniref:LacI family DNA-binding transcriptional regulator n=1 Tax=Streptomyces sp. NPDC093591 TaxID=3366044 RepID=UPI00382A07B7
MAEVRPSKAPTINDIAREAGVSKSAVSLALLGQGRLSEETRERILRVAQRLGYVKNAMAQGLVASRTFTLGMLVRDASRPFYGHLQTLLQARAVHHGYRVVTTTGAREFALEEERRGLQTLLSLRVEGLIVCSGLLPVDDIVPFTERVPTVVAGRPEHHPAVSSVFCDEEDGAEQLVDHLLGLGHRSVVVLLVPERQSLTEHRRGAAMVRRLREAGAAVTEVEASTPGVTAEGATAAVLGDPAVTAVMCPSDWTLVAVLEAFREAGIRVPDDVSATGYDGVGELTTPLLGLTTLYQPLDEIAKRAVDLLVEQLGVSAQPVRHIALRGTLRVGTTTASPTRRARS